LIPQCETRVLTTPDPMLQFERPCRYMHTGSFSILETCGSCDKQQEVTMSHSQTTL